MDLPKTAVPLALLAVETGTPIEELAANLGDDVTVDQKTGIRSVSAVRCRLHLADRADKVRRAELARLREKASGRPDPVIALRQRLAARPVVQGPIGGVR